MDMSTAVSFWGGGSVQGGVPDISRQNNGEIYIQNIQKNMQQFHCMVHS
jgi:hypothetical protein